MNAFLFTSANLTRFVKTHPEVTSVCVRKDFMKMLLDAQVRTGNTKGFILIVVKISFFKKWSMTETKRYINKDTTGVLSKL